MWYRLAEEKVKAENFADYLQSKFEPEREEQYIGGSYDSGHWLLPNGTLLTSAMGHDWERDEAGKLGLDVQGVDSGKSNSLGRRLMSESGVIRFHVYQGGLNVEIHGVPTPDQMQKIGSIANKVPSFMFEISAGGKYSSGNSMIALIKAVRAL